MEKIKTDRVYANAPTVPFFLFGHSMGGAIATLVAHERPDLFLSGGVIIHAPAYRGDPKVATPSNKFAGELN